MKILKILIINLLLVSSLLASEKPKIIATTTIIASITNEIGDTLVEIESLVPVGGDPHLYEPIPQDAMRIVNANLILMNGLSLEGWLNEFIKHSGTKAKVVTTTVGIDAITSDKYANSPDPHAWMDAANGVIYAENIKNALIELDKANEETYNKNFEILKGKLLELDSNIKSLIESIPEEKRVLITSHDAFKYYGRKYGLRLESILGTSTDAQAQTSDINRLYKTIKETGIPAIFIESTINPQTIQQIAKDTKVKVGGKLYADSLGEPDSEAGTYQGMLWTNTQTIVNSLTGKGELTETESIPTKENKRNNLPFILLITAVLLGGTWFMLRKVNR